jgi:aminoglycoside phosphotransferase (APT) family kinase protein
MGIAVLPEKVSISVSLVGRLIATQFPEWADLPIKHVPSDGTQHALYRLGEDMVVRLPHVQDADGQARKEFQWLPLLAPSLPLAIPVPLVMGDPADSYPWHWSVYRWFEGDTAATGRIANHRQAATDLGKFISALQRADPAGAPMSGRGVSLTQRDSYTRKAIASLDGTIDADAVTAAWEASLLAPAWESALVWTHGDLFPSNILVKDGRLSAVIDFGDAGLSDPACDMLGAWSFLSVDVHEFFRAELSVSDATWARGRGWALSIALLALKYFRGAKVPIVHVATKVVREVLADHERSGNGLR